MGVAYLGSSPGGRLVAVKVVRPWLAREARYRARFRREVTAARSVTSAFTAPLVDADPEADPPWLATAYLPGLSLGEAVGTFGGLPPDAVRLLAAALAEALAEIHGVGLTHRDLKPGNIMLTAGGPRVIDFGIARPMNASVITLPGALLGTPGFMSPEQASGGLAGQPGDVFALGAVLAFAATGRGPFDAEDRGATLERIRQTRADLGGISDRRLRTLIVPCLRRDPERRPTAAALLERLGEPAVSVHGTRWLPAPLAEAIDLRAARAPQATAAGEPSEASEPREGEESARLAEPAVDPAAETVDATEPARPVDSPDEPSKQPGRRGLLLALAAVPMTAAGAVALGWPLVSAATDDANPTRSPPDTPSASESATGSATGPPSPPEAATRWRVKVFAGTDFEPAMFAAGGVVLAYGGTGYVHALDPRTGETLWKRFSTTGRERTLVVGGDMVYMFDDPDRGDSIHAVDAASGVTRWSHHPGFSYPEVAVAGSVFCVLDDGVVVALDPQDGQPRWTTDVDGTSVDAGPGLVIASNGEEMTALDPDSGRILWRRTLEEPYIQVVDGGLVCARDDFGTLYAIRADDGTLAWRKELHYRNNARRLSDGMLFMDDGDGYISALRIEDGETAWSRRLGQHEENPWGESQLLGLSGGTLYVGTTDHTVYALDTADGHTLWTYPALAVPSNDEPGAVVLDGVVYLGTTEIRRGDAPGDAYVEALSPPATTSRPDGSPYGEA
jgi:hypothetical protein